MSIPKPIRIIGLALLEDVEMSKTPSDGEEPVSVIAFVDTVPNVIKPLPDGPDRAGQLLQGEFSSRLPSMVQRYSSLAAVIFKAEGRFVTLVREARSLFVEGFHRGAIALTGSAIEFLCDDLIRNRISDISEREALLKLDFRHQVEELEKRGSFRNPRTKQLFHKIYDIRNRHVHPHEANASESQAHVAVQLLALAVIAEFGLLPDSEGKVRLSSESAVESMVKEFGLSDVLP